MKNLLKFRNLLVVVAVVFMTPKVAAQDIAPSTGYTLIIDGYDWGPGASKVVLTMDKSISETKSDDFSVTVQRSSEGVSMHPNEAQGIRKVVHAYVSDEKGNSIPEGRHVTLVLFVSPNDALASPIKYIFKNNRGGNQWIDYKMAIHHIPSEREWDTETARRIPSLENFNLNGTYSHNNRNLTYASFKPKTITGKYPLLIWLHGGGEGGTDPSIALIANKAWNYASENMQSVFEGAYVLVPQTPTFWMQDSSGEHTRGAKNDIYNEALMELIKKYVADNPNIDQNRIYIGGCSNGGYMSLKLILNHPDYFAAGYISALAYQDKFITDEQVALIKNMPIWFLHSKDDPVTIPEETVVPLYKRLVAAGAENIHFSYYDHVIDLSGFYGGKNYHFNGHWSWIYSHVNHADFDFDGGPILHEGNALTLMEWLALQKK